MACVTLKRPLDFDPLEVLHSPNRPPTKRRRCTPIKNVDRNGLLLPQSSRMSNAAAAALNGTTASGPSVFKETPLTEGDISNNLRDELRRMKRRRQLVSQNIAAQMGNTVPNFSNSSINTVDNLPRSPRSAPSSPEPMFQEVGNMSPKSASSSHVPRASVSTSRELENSSNQMSQHETSVGLHADSSIQCNSSNVPSTSNRNIKALMGTGDKPVFTLKQMTLICERMCKERTDAVRQEYDKILHQKLSEQYDAFVKFIDHQIQQRFNESQLPSYLS